MALTPLVSGFQIGVRVLRIIRVRGQQVGLGVCGGVVHEATLSAEPAQGQAVAPATGVLLQQTLRALLAHVLLRAQPLSPLFPVWSLGSVTLCAFLWPLYPAVGREGSGPGGRGWLRARVYSHHWEW